MSDVTKQIAYLERQRKRHQDELPFAQGYAERDDTQFVIDAYSAAIEALSHAAGQEAVAWQCRLIAIATGEVVDDWRECSKESFDVEGGRHRDGAYLRTEYRALYLAPPTTSAEVGQDGEQCRAASGEPDAWLYEYEHDGESDHCLSRVRFLPSWVEAKRATESPLYLRALSRGVPEGNNQTGEGQ